eukprot:8037900-Pyramimonas_sp.AAC.1
MVHWLLQGVGGHAVEGGPRGRLHGQALRQVGHRRPIVEASGRSRAAGRRRMRCGTHDPARS